MVNGPIINVRIYAFTWKAMTSSFGYLFKSVLTPKISTLCAFPAHISMLPLPQEKFPICQTLFLKMLHGVPQTASVSSTQGLRRANNSRLFWLYFLFNRMENFNKNSLKFRESSLLDNLEHSQVRLR